MVGRGSDRRAGNGWRRSVVAGVVAAVVAVGAITYLVVSLVGGKAAPTPVVERLTLICTECGEVYTVSPEDVGLEGGGTTDVYYDLFAAKSVRVPCPKCKSTASRVAFTCRACGKPFLPPDTAPTDGQPFRCPHCGGDPWRAPSK